MEIDQQASFNWLRSHPTAFLHLASKEAFIFTRRHSARSIKLRLNTAIDGIKAAGDYQISGPCLSVL
jgi:hypothetical protein